MWRQIRETCVGHGINPSYSSGARVTQMPPLDPDVPNALDRKRGNPPFRRRDNLRPSIPLFSSRRERLRGPALDPRYEASRGQRSRSQAKFQIRRFHHAGGSPFP